MNSQANMKVGFMGFAGSGKTFTASSLAFGLHQHIKSQAPLFFLDTETGSDFMVERARALGIKLFVAKTRAFSDLVPAIREAERQGAILMIDSITHYWRELTDSYQKKTGRPRLLFQDWAYLKAQWGKFTDEFVNSSCHIIMCGRAGFEYDYFEDEAGKKELQKTGIKMKAEGETGYEASLLILMEREMDLETKEVTRIAHILKDRSDRIDGKSFRNPTFADFLPHVEYLNLGGVHVGVDTTRTSEADIQKPDSGWDHEREQRTILLDEIETLLVEFRPGQSAEAKAAKIALLKGVFGTAAWERIKTFDSKTLKAGYADLRAKLEPQGAGDIAPSGNGSAVVAE